MKLYLQIFLWISNSIKEDKLNEKLVMTYLRDLESFWKDLNFYLIDPKMASNHNTTRLLLSDYAITES